MRPGRPSLRPTPATATRHLRPVLIEWLGRAVELPRKRRRRCTPALLWQVILFAAAFARAIATAVTVQVALLDKAFFSIAVMRLLQSRNVPFVIPAVVRGRKPRPGVKAVGLRALRNRGAGRYTYTHEDRGASVRINVAVAHKSYRHKQTGRRCNQKLLYATWRVGGKPVSIRDRYRKRFGVESSYRQLESIRKVRRPFAWVFAGI